LPILTRGTVAASLAIFNLPMGHHRNLGKFIEESNDRQRNIVFPDTVRNTRSADVFFWKGSSHPTLVQRIAAWMFGLAFMAAGMESLILAVKTRIDEGFSFGVVFMAAFSLSFVLLGIRIFRNGFPRHRNTDPK
jgi:hypothetical protein